MRRIIYRKLPIIIRLTKKSPGKHTINSLSDKVGLSVSTVWKYCNELNLPIKKRKEYTDEEKEFVKTHAPVMTNTEISRALGLKTYQVSDIAKKVGVDCMLKVREQKQESEFFEHDKFYYH